MIFEKQINPRTQKEYYAGSINDVKQFIRALDLNSDGILGNSNIDTRIEFYMDAAELLIDGQLSNHYFTPISQYNHDMGNGVIIKDYPAIIKSIALWFASAMLMQADFQQQEPNGNQMSEFYHNKAELELYKLSLFTYKLPGQRYRTKFSPTMPPTLQPTRKPEKPI